MIIYSEMTTDYEGNPGTAARCPHLGIPGRPDGFSYSSIVVVGARGGQPSQCTHSIKGRYGPIGPACVLNSLSSAGVAEEYWMSASYHSGNFLLPKS
jgi:hypothetical protein